MPARRTHLALCGFLLCCVISSGSTAGSEGAAEDAPHVFVALQTRNSAHLLPNFFGYLENLDYPKSRISVWVRTDHNLDDTPAVLEAWCTAVRDVYLSVDCQHSKKVVFDVGYPPPDTDEQYRHTASVQQTALEAGRRSGAQYFFVLNTDNFITNPQTLRLLIAEDRVVTAPMLNSEGNAAFSNFWMDQDSLGYYKRHEDYLPILQRNFTGCFRAPVLLPPLLIHLSSPQSQSLIYHPPLEGFNGPTDDIVHFAYSAKMGGVAMFICNTELFGYIMRPHTHPSLKVAAEKFVDFKTKTLVNYPPVIYSQFVPAPAQPKSNMGLDAVYMISLVRRPERRNRMIACLDELGFDYIVFDAVDGRKLNASYVEGELGIHYMSNWRDPWGDRTMTFGEVGCFLSHYFIWKKVVDEGLDRVLVVEDDIDFEPRFREGLAEVMKEVEVLTPTWDLIYAGRKRLYLDSEPAVHGSRRLVRPAYSYWTLGYLLSNRGARKLLEADPFHSFLPVDEYFPILFGKHPQYVYTPAVLSSPIPILIASKFLLHMYVLFVVQEGVGPALP
ncbi:Procollagen galactosyltransferase 1 [Geodia barretti]|uniref:Procollagen galactosyltransferase 1 n=1 Tax=Geodia barretti TaxID=519541 RepID=A0AA35TAY1_GEOBA|nr:Procollagen galactosyltransferase 1 [Geodia barretti]